MEVVLGTKIKGLNMLNQLGWLISSYKSYMFVSLCECQNQGEAYKSDSHIP